MQRFGLKKLLTLVVCGICLCVCLTGCTVGNGKSAYEVAVANGFVGTEVEWLNSLKAEQSTVTTEELYASAVANGYQGSFLEFLKEYLAFDEGSDLVYASNKALRSVVAVEAKHTGTQITYVPFLGYQEEQVKYSSSGSGVIWSLDKTKGDAYIVTNFHVVYSKNSNNLNKLSNDINISLYGYPSDVTIPAEYIGGSMVYDVAVLKVTESLILSYSDCVEAERASSNDLLVGQSVVAVGNAEGMGISVTKGVVSVPSEYISLTAIDEQTVVEMRVLRIDAGINAGNSGGGLFDQYGRLVGVVNAKMVDEEIEAMGYAIPSSVVTGVVHQILTTGDVKVCNLGAKYEAQDSRLVFDDTESVCRIHESIVVTGVTLGGISSGKLQKGDVITAVGFVGEEMTTLNRVYELTDFLLFCQKGDVLVLQISRDGATQTVEIALGAGDFSSTK